MKTIMKLKKISVSICVHLWLISLGFLPASAQVRPVNDYGALGLAQLLKRLNTTASVMMIGAHPDDEDSALIAYLARGESARTAYLSLTRGDGGQNIIGPELGEALGVLRTEELLQARRLDGAEQYFTRAYDYGFSKTLAEAKSKWPEEVIKCDVVRAIRLFRPLVVISRFTGTPADGHGQHQYAGYISPIAVKAAADPQACIDAGTPWQILKFYIEQSFSDTSQPTLKINTGQYDPILGRSYFEIAMEGRSMHRSQGEGRLELHGEQFSGLNLVGTKTKKIEKETSIFDGLNVSVAGVDDVLNSSDRATSADLLQAASLAEKAKSEFRIDSAQSTVTNLLIGLNAIEAAAADRNRKFDAIFLLREKIVEYFAALRIASGIQIDAFADKETIVPGEPFIVGVKAYAPAKSALRILSIEVNAPSDWKAEKIGAPKENNAVSIRREIATSSNYLNVTAPRDERLTQPYWLVSPRSGNLYAWPSSEYKTHPFEGRPLTAKVYADVNNEQIVFHQPLQFRYADPARGEIRRETNVVPALSVSVDRDLLILRQKNRSQTQRLVVSVTNNSEKEQSGKISLNAQAKGVALIIAPNGPTFDLKTRGAKASIPVDVTIPAGAVAGSIPIQVSATVSEGLFGQTMNVVAYPHIQTHRYYTPAETTVEVLDLKTAPAKIGYIMGSGDEVPEAIRQMGMDVTMLEEKDLASGDLSKFDTIVVGIRASETRPDVLANKQRLMDYVNNGGNLVMQYQRNNFAQSGLAPYPIDTKDKQGTTAGDVARVVDENAPVKILEPTNPIFNFPNKITDEDFKGWVQERNAYNLVTFDPKYTPLLESHDAGEQENKGGLVIAKVGKGNWVYCSYSFFRQLPAGVPGAYRLFDNLLSLPRSK